MTTLRIAVAAGVLCWSGISAAGEMTWELAREGKARDDVSTWTRDVEGQTLDAFKGQIEVPYSMLTVLAVIADVDRFPDWVYQCDYAKLMPEIANNVTYVHIEGIWPVSDRDVVTETEVTQDPNTLAIRLSTEATGGLYPKQPGKVRLPALQNDFTLEPLDDGWTRLTFETFVDPGGFIPGWLANIVAVRAPQDSLEGMYEIMAEEQYQLTEASQLPAIFPVWQTLTFPNAGKAAE